MHVYPTNSYSYFPQQTQFGTQQSVYAQQTPNINYVTQQLRMQQQQQQTSNGLKGRPVSSLDEVRATGIDFDGSVFYFPDLANKRIYTKQINLDGTASLCLYEFKDLPLASSADPSMIATDNFVSKEEFQTTITSLLNEIERLRGGTENVPNEQQSKQPIPEFKF